MRRAIMSSACFWPMTRWLSVSASLSTASISFLTMRPTGMPVQSCDDAGDGLLVDRRQDQRRVALELGQLVLQRRELGEERLALGFAQARRGCDCAPRRPRGRRRPSPAVQRRPARPAAAAPGEADAGAARGSAQAPQLGAHLEDLVDDALFLLMALLQHRKRVSSSSIAFSVRV